MICRKASLYGEAFLSLTDEKILRYGSVINKHGALTPLTAPHGWEWFDSIRSDPRFDAYVQRVKVLFEEKVP